ncbi:MAG TPA: GatB/YqeY domain-containing protein [Burkholderiales bacterium]|nr:GatB/YqeY domain-containing protein [Burkholderiales bacterium]
MLLKDRITEDMKSALRAKDSARLSAIRLLLAAIKQREVDERITLGDVEVVSVIEKMLKQRRDSIQQFDAAGRKDLADNERFEVTVLQAYMPKALSEAEVEAAVTEAIGVSGAKGVQDMGKVMTLVKPKLAGRADMAKVSALVKSRLSAAAN